MKLHNKFMLFAVLVLATLNGCTGSNDQLKSNGQTGNIETNTAKYTSKPGTESTVSNESASVNTANIDPEIKLVHDIKSWNHPVKKTFSDNSIDLVKVELRNEETYPVFHIKLPYEINLKNEDLVNSLTNEVALSNGYWDYEIIDEAHTGDIKVQCDRKNKKVLKVTVNGEENYFNNLFIKENEDIIKSLTSMNENQLEILAKDDIDNDGFNEAVIKYKDRLLLMRFRNGSRGFIGEIKDYIGVVHEIESVEIKRLDNSNTKYIVTYSYQALNGGNGFAVYSLINDKISIINKNFYGATAKGHSSLEDINNDGILDSILRIRHYDLQQHILAIYTKWDGTGDTHYKIEYEDAAKFVYPAKPEDVIQNYIEDYCWKEYLEVEMSLLTEGKVFKIADFENSFGTPSTLEYGGVNIDYKVVSDASNKKVISATVKNEKRACYCFTVELKDGKWVITAISKSNPDGGL